MKNEDEKEKISPMSEEEDDNANETMSLIGKDEMNIVEFPITLLSERNPSGQKTIEFSDTIVTDNHMIIEREWVVTGSEKFGLPLVQDNDVLLALLFIGKRNGFESPTIYFTCYEICNVMKVKPSGRVYKRIEGALDRLMGVVIKTKNSFWDNEKKVYKTLSFGILDSYFLFERKDGITRKPRSEIKSFVTLNSIFYRSIQNGYIKNIDLDVYYELPSPVTRRLYRYLDKKSYNRKKFEMDLFKLAHEHVGLSKKRPCASQIKQKLDPAHKELIDINFLKSVSYIPTPENDSEKVVYVFGSGIKKKNTKQLMPPREKALEVPDIKSLSDSHKEIYNSLVAVGVTGEIALQLVRDYPEDRIKKQLEILPFRNANEPAALLVKSIREDWAPSRLYLDKIEAKKERSKELAVEQKKEEEEIKRKEAVENHIANMSEEERQALYEEALELIKKRCGPMALKDIPELSITGHMKEIVAERLGYYVSSNHQKRS